VNVALVTDQLNVTHATAGKLIAQLVRVGLLEEITGQKRNRIFRYTPYWRLFQDADDSEPMADAEDRTGAPTS
jgi:DNA-binding MarR family transcriptional regulator